jgi:GntR family transcriptional regulator, transcriptional repressor for pyruvate dehydrogenase complex
VSRPTLRQAFRILETEHLIAVQRGSRGGGTVFRPSTKLASRYLSDLLRYRSTTLGDVLAAQLMIEPAAVTQLARRRDEETLNRLRSLVTDQPDPDEFHVDIVGLAGNPVLAQYSALIHCLIGEQIESVRSTRRDDDGVAIAHSSEAHATLVDLVSAGAAHAAAEHWRSHLNDVHAKLAERVDLNAQLEAPSR